MALLPFCITMKSHNIACLDLASLFMSSSEMCSPVAGQGLLVVAFAEMGRPHVAVSPALAINVIQGLGHN